MDSTFKFSRLMALIRYNRSAYAKIYLTVFGLAEVALAGIMTLRLMTSGSSMLSDNFISGSKALISFFFLFSVLGVMVRLTQFVHRKINHRNNSIPFVMLPASNLEKFVEIQLSFLVGMVIAVVLMFVNGIIFLKIPSECGIFSETVSEAITEIGNMPDIRFLVRSLTTLFAIYCVFIYILYLNLNMLFRKNPQPKSIFVMWLLSGFLMFYIYQISDLGVQPIPQYINRWEMWVACGLGIIPTIALFFGFYYQMKEKEIK